MPWMTDNGYPGDILPRHPIQAMQTRGASTIMAPNRNPVSLVLAHVRQCALAAALLLPAAVHAEADGPVAGDLETIRMDVAELRRDLTILEEELLFPASSQMSVFLAMDVGEFFQLDAVTLELNGEKVAHHLYTERQADALFRGGVHKLWLGNVRQGENELTAFFVGRGPEGREYKRATSVAFEKSFEPTYVELAISDSQARYQPDFRATVVD